VSLSCFDGWREVWLNAPSLSSIQEEELRRDAACAIALAFDGTGQGIGVKNKRGVPRDEHQVDLFHFLCEGRAWGNPTFSTCGEGVGCWLSLLGCRIEGLVNRDDDDHDGVKDTKQPAADWRGTRDWKIGWDIILLTSGSKHEGCWVPASLGQLPKPGDCFLIGSGGSEHVGMFVADPEETENENEWSVQVVAAGHVDAGGQCCDLGTDYLEFDPGTHQWFLGGTKGKRGREMQGFVDLSKLPLDAPAIVPPGFDQGKPA